MSDPLSIRPTAASIAAFLCLTLLLVEAHELCHALATRALCGGWSGRVFDNVLPYRGCGSERLALIDIVAPSFTYACLWLGAAWMGGRRRRRQVFGFSLLFASLPLGRVLPQVVTAFADGSTSDEYSFVRHLAGPSLSRGAAGGIAIAIAVALTVPPLLFAWRRLQPAGRPRLFAAFYGLPLLFVIGWLMLGMNGLLVAGALAWLGSAAWPGLVIVHTAVIGSLFLLLRRRLFDLAPPAAA